ncbi:uncharacterized protein LOC124257174 [Haliotis rubra]|uniref:uncharacterized protein LOC124257174 n=1 Tax=Haliotis rubra TaxID=36100 RepID=UPI001EE63167|nr:uncharacterized protein LOC124257174 [Haliotis rubra]XP_046547150.1 uncharacterized protein LOC124257174 [Haliotis rubra]XP_046547151.1 uncharacterized protein LOC124257174 [Haliotis rubra]
MDLEAVRVLAWPEFLACPGQLHQAFTKENGQLTYDCQFVFDLTTPLAAEQVGVGYHLQKNEIILIIHNEAEMTSLVGDLLRKLLLMRITVLHTEISSKYSVETISILEDEFAVLINTSHPSIITRLGDGLKCAALRMSRCRKFCLELDMSTSLHDWYAEHKEAITSCDDIHQMKVRRARLYVTNHTIYSHCFDCKPHWWLCLCFCWLLSAPCYMSYRKLTCTDIYVEIHGEITPAKCVQDESSRVAIDSSRRCYQTV